jgi:prevent-host-death family protein
MKTLSLSEAKAKLSSLIEELTLTDEPLVITRNGRPAAIIIPPHEFESWRETIEIKSNQEFLAEIRASLNELKTKRTKLYSLNELFGDGK